jgi:hypothetical protein
MSRKYIERRATHPPLVTPSFSPKKIPTCPAGIFFCSSPLALLRKAKI